MTAVSAPVETKLDLASLYQQTFQRIAGYALWKTGSAETAAEVAQDAIIDVWRAAANGSFDYTHDPVGLAITAGARRTVDRIRRAACRVTLVHQEPEALAALGDIDTDVEDRIVRKLDAESLVKTLFTNRFHAATAQSAANSTNVAAGLMQGLTYDQIASTYNIAPGTVRTTVMKMRQRLQPQYGEQARAIINS